MTIPSTRLSLLCELGTGNRDGAWAQFHTRYRDVIFGWCLRRGLPVESAEDLTQDVLLKLFQQLPNYRHDSERGRFRAWLKSVVNNALTDFWRKQQRNGESLAVGGTAFLERMANLTAPEVADELSTAIEERAQRSAEKVCERVRSRLKETTWRAFQQTMIEERPAAAVAAELNLSLATVYKAVYRVKQMLLEEYHDGDSARAADRVPRPHGAGEPAEGNAPPG